MEKIFFIHGNSGSSSTWRRQFDDPIFDGYHLIAIDLPAHGNSSDYLYSESPLSVITLAGIILDAVNKIATGNPYILVGFSLGTNLIAEMLELGSDPKGIVLVSACLVSEKYGMDKVFKAEAVDSILFLDDVQPGDIEVYHSRHFLKENKENGDIFKANYILVRAPFRTSLLRSGIAGNFSDEVKLIESFRGRVLIIYGREDTLINIQYLDDAKIPLWNDHICILEQSGHFLHMESPEKINQLCKSYFLEQFKDSV
jgi:pimeloyl-ACP methyl ester carboxylesterase